MDVVSVHVQLVAVLEALCVAAICDATSISDDSTRCVAHFGGTSWALLLGHGDLVQGDGLPVLGKVTETFSCVAHIDVSKAKRFCVHEAILFAFFQL